MCQPRRDKLLPSLHRIPSFYRGKRGEQKPWEGEGSSSNVVTGLFVNPQQTQAFNIATLADSYVDP